MLSDLLDLLVPTVYLAFSTPSVPQWTPPPTNPLEDEERARQRENKASAAAADLATSGRRSTMYAGTKIARDAQMERGKKRLGIASDELLG
jgi:hypothetical protein